MFKYAVPAAVVLGLAGCGGSSGSSDFSGDIRFATYHVDMEYSDFNTALSETASGNVQRLQNVAEVIQIANADVLLLTGISGADGSGNDGYRYSALNQFLDSYVGVAQDADVKAVEYRYVYMAQSNSGIPVLEDIDRDGSAAGTLPGDAVGYGNYWGQKSFAILSKYQLDTNGVRNFRELKWSAVPGVTEPKDASGANWFTHDTWQQMPLLNSNFIDIPLSLPDGRKIQLMATYLETPKEIDSSDRGYQRNSAQLSFIADYLGEGADHYIVNDKTDSGQRTGGYDDSRPFVLLGNFYNDHEGAWAVDAEGKPSYVGDSSAMRSLVNSSSLNRFTGVNWEAPTTQAAVDYAKTTQSTHDMPEIWTSLDGIRSDYIMLERQLNYSGQGIVWEQVGGDNEALFYLRDGDGNLVNDADASSSHRLVWMDVTIN